jgi:DNA replication and repair protein RecF
MTKNGPHRSDFLITYTNKNMPAAHCSTGEQKALLVGIILAHARLVTGERGEAPLLLLDEVVAHLDNHRRAVLAQILKNYGSQIWITGTDRALFNDFKGHVSFFDVVDSSVTR